MTSYSILATSKTPSLIIYLLDISASMDVRRKGKRKIEIAFEALISALNELIARSTKGRVIQKRYRVAVFAYSDKVYDVLADAGLPGGIQPIDQVAKFLNKIRTPQPLNGTNTAAAFSVAHSLLYHQKTYIQTHPAPLICHLTDGKYDEGQNPNSSIQAIKSIQNSDGAALIENIYIPEKIDWQQDIDLEKWDGINSNSELPNGFAKELVNWSSPIPESYRISMREKGIPISSNAKMFFPGTRPDLVRLGMQMAAASE
jgi:hypothetical protein